MRDAAVEAGEPWTLSARALAQRIAQGELSAREATEAHISRIEEVNPALNAVVWKRYEQAREEAGEVDRRRSRGDPLGALAGVPITIKECLDLTGSPSTFGVPARKTHRAERDDEYVSRLRAAGAIVLGKTNAAQCLLFVESDNPLYGREHMIRIGRVLLARSGVLWDFYDRGDTEQGLAALTDRRL